MKIVYLSSSNIPSKAANSINVTNMCQAFYELGNDITLITPKYPNTLEEDIYTFYGIDKEINIVRIKRNNSKFGLIFYLIHVFLQLKRIHPDRVVGRCVYSCYLATVLGFDVVFDSHRPEWEGGKIYFSFFKKMVVSKKLVKLTLNSNALKKIYEKNDFMNQFRFKIVVANNGARIYPLDQKVQLPGKNTYKVGYVGHLYKGRGIDIIIECANILKNVDFILVGGETKDINYWKNRVIGENAYFLGFIPPQEIFKFRNSFDILLAPYQKDVYTQAGFNSVSFMNPIKILEYMSSKKPIIASSLPAIEDILEHETNGLLVKSDDVNEWCSQILRLISNQELSQKISEQSYKDFLNYYTWKSRAKKFL
ncbi:glycosyltransferase [Cyclobacteriaceae bacterium YHN15]|nr:glycosyltransferase [Cyclobacteriaceae bacterium YHN15]